MNTQKYIHDKTFLIHNTQNSGENPNSRLDYEYPTSLTFSHIQSASQRSWPS